MLSAYTLATIPNSFSKELIDYCYDKYDIPLEIIGVIFKYMKLHDIRHWSTNLMLSSRLNYAYICYDPRGGLLDQRFNDMGIECYNEHYKGLGCKWRTGSILEQNINRCFLLWTFASTTFVNSRSYEHRILTNKILTKYMGKNWEQGWSRWPAYTDKFKYKEFSQRTYNKIHSFLWDWRRSLADGNGYKEPTDADVLELMPQSWLYGKALTISECIASKPPKKSWSKTKLIGYIWNNNYLVL